MIESKFKLFDSRGFWKLKNWKLNKKKVKNQKFFSFCGTSLTLLRSFYYYTLILSSIVFIIWFRFWCVYIFILFLSFYTKYILFRVSDEWWMGLQFNQIKTEAQTYTYYTANTKQHKNEKQVVVFLFYSFPFLAHPSSSADEHIALLVITNNHHHFNCCSNNSQFFFFRFNHLRAQKSSL